MGIDAERVKSAMAELGLGQSALARAIGVTPAAVQQIVSGKTRQSVHLAAIASVLGVRSEWLLGQDDERYDHSKADQNLEEISLWSLKNLVANMWQDFGLASYDFRIIPFRNDKNAELNRYGMFTQIGDNLKPLLSHNDTILVDLDDISFRPGDDIWVAHQRNEHFICLAGELPSGERVAYRDLQRTEVLSLRRNGVGVVGRIVWYGRSL